MRIVYSLHAEQQLRERRIEKTWVEDTIHRPDVLVRMGRKCVASKKINGHSRKVDDNTLIDFDRKGNIVGIELLFVSERNPSLIKELKAENIISA